MTEEQISTLAESHSDTQAVRMRPRARVMRILGRELISSEIVAIVELVKNAYDADAKRVLIRFEGDLANPSEARLDVADNGHGMRVETVLSDWLEPATPGKKKVTLSEGGRRVLGEKGVGRFASSRLGETLTLSTRRAGEPLESLVYLDWTQFDDDDLYLDQVQVAWGQRAPADIHPGGVLNDLWEVDEERPSDAELDHGTLLRMAPLRSGWSEDEIKDLRRALARLIRPGAETLDFSIRLELPEPFVELSGLVDPIESVLRPDYTIKGTVAADGTYAIEYWSGQTGETEKILGRFRFSDRPPQSGPFDVNLSIWNRDTEWLKSLARELGSTLGELRKDLDQIAGISIYRDRFRVLPYGEPRNDWLRLDLRRVQNPTLRLSQNQISGYVSISADANPELRDQSNREGLLEGPALDDLRRMLTGFLAIVEARRYKERRPEIEPAPDAPPRQPGLFDAFRIDDLAEAVRRRHPDDSDLHRLVADTQQNVEQGVGRVKEVLARYRRLATLGQLIDTVLHNTRAPLAAILNEAKLAIRRLGRAESVQAKEQTLASLQLIQQQGEVMAGAFRRMEPLGGRKRGRPREIQLEGVIADAVGAHRADLDHLGATVKLPTSATMVTAEVTEIHEVVHNLMTNSIHWLSNVPPGQRAIEIQVQRAPDGSVEILHSDSGPGVDPAIRDEIFSPYFTTRDEGVGLGLTVVGDIVTDYYGGELALLDHGPLPGATFRVTLRRRV